jgi:hypothetical protein
MPTLYYPLRSQASIVLQAYLLTSGEMAEWSKALVLKTSKGL